MISFLILPVYDLADHFRAISSALVLAVLARVVKILTGHPKSFQGFIVDKTW